MRITYIHQYFNTPAMSGGTRSYEMARRLVQAGHDVNMITASRAKPSEPEFNGTWTTTSEAGITVHWTQVPYGNALSFRDRIRAFLAFMTRASRKATELPADLVFATSTPLTVAIPGLWGARHHKVPFVFEVRDLWPELPIAIGAITNPFVIRAAKWLERTAYRKAAHVIALSPGMADGVLRHGIPEKRVHCIPNSCDIEAFDIPEEQGQAFRDSDPWISDRPLFVYTGTLGHINGVGFVPRLAAAMRERGSDARFVILGAGAELENVNSEAKRLNVLDDNLRMLPPIPKEEVPVWLSAATASLCLFKDVPEMWKAASPNKAFDALAASRPVLTNHGGWLTELIEERGAGMQLPRDAGEAAEKLDTWLNVPDMIQSASAEAGRLARERFSRDLLAEAFENVLQRAVGNLR